MKMGGNVRLSIYEKNNKYMYMTGNARKYVDESDLGVDGTAF
jgi:hypothetical protein